MTCLPFVSPGDYLPIVSEEEIKVEGNVIWDSGGIWSQVEVMVVIIGCWGGLRLWRLRSRSWFFYHDLVLSTLIIPSVICYRSLAYEFRRLRCADSHNSLCKLQRNCTLKDAAKFRSRLPHFELPRREFPRCPTSWQWRPDFGLSLHFQRPVNQSDVAVASVM